MEARPASDREVAETMAREFLLTSFVCDVGWFGGYPTLRFANKDVPNEIWLSMGGGFEIDPLPELPTELTSRQRSLLSLESILGYQVKAVQCRQDGRLEIIFGNQTTLVALDDNPDEHECWEMRNEQGGLIVAGHGGGVAVWRPNTPTN